MTETRTVVEDDAEPPDEEFTDQTEFLNAIYIRFVTFILPIECDLVDHLKASHVFDSEDEDNIRAEKSRKSRARWCWSRLNRVPPKQFHEHCIPALKATCASAVEGKTFRWDGRVEGCLRHLLKRTVPLRRFADMFPGTGGCSHKEYQKIIEGNSHDDTLWDLVFDLCSRNTDNSAFMKMMETTLKNIEVPVPADLPSQLASRVPCVCVKTGTKRKRKASKKREKGKKRHKFENEASKTAEMEKLSAMETFPLPKASKKREKGKKRHKKFKKEAHKTTEMEKHSAMETFPLPKASKKRENGKKRHKKFKKEAHKTTEMEKHSAMETFPLPKSSPSDDADKQHPTSEPCPAAAGHSHNASRADAEGVKVKLEEEDDDYCFASEEQKETFLKRLEEINETITKVSGMKAVFLEVSGIQMELTALSMQTRPEASEETILRYKGKTLRLHAKIRDIREKLNSNYEQASRIRKELEPTGSDAQVPCKFESSLQERREVLVSEFAEAESFYKKSCDIFNELNVALEKTATDSQPVIDKSMTIEEICQNIVDETTQSDVEIPFNEMDDDFEESSFESDQYNEVISFEEDHESSDDGEDDADDNYEDYFNFTDEDDDADVNDGENTSYDNYEENDISYTDEEFDIDANDGEDDINYADDTGYFGEDDDADFDDEEFGASD